MLDVNYEPAFDEPLPPMPEPEPEPEPEPAAPHADDPGAQLERRSTDVVTQAKTFAAAVKDKASAEAAAQYALTIDGLLKDAHAYFDPLVARARQPWEDRCEERRRVCDPLEAAKAALVGKEGAVTRYDREVKEAAAREQARLQREADEKAERDRQAELQRARAKDAEAMRQREAEAAAKRQGDAAAAAAARAAADAAARDAQESRTAAVEIEAPVIQVTAERPQVRGVSGRDLWTFEVTDHMAFYRAVTGADQMLSIVSFRIQLLESKAQQTADDVAVLAALIDLRESFRGITPLVSPEAITTNDVYLRGRAKTDKNTLKWPGVRFFNQGSTSTRQPRGERT